MDKTEAGLILQHVIDGLRELPYRELVGTYLDAVDTFETVGESGSVYQLEVQGMWDAPRLKGGNLRLMTSIDDGGWRAFVPLTTSFIKAPDGSFVGE